MTKEQTPEQQFAEYMTGKTELSHVYQQLDTDGPGEMTDQRILAAARKSVEIATHGAGRRGIRWYIPTAIAASLIMFSVAIVFRYTSDTPVSPELAKKEALDREITSNLKHDPARLLNEIVQLYKDGKVDMAQDQLAAFKQLHPDYEIDFTKYPELKELDKSR